MPHPADEKLHRLLTQSIDAEFMKNGFRADRHTEAVLAALERTGYRIVKWPEELQAAYKTGQSNA
jgi:hypothetical protein